MQTELVVCACANPTPDVRRRAVALSRAFGVACVRRDAVPTGALAYVVGRDAEWLTDGADRLRVDVGLLHAKAAAGADHPLIRAVGPARRVFDGTLGLAGDALHLAEALGAEVVASELSPAVFALVGSALPRLAASRWAGAAGRVRPMLGPAAEVVRREGPFDCAFFAPMFESPARAAPGYALFRRVAVHLPLDAETLEAARSVCPRVVVRVERGGPSPEPDGWERLPGKAVDYHVWRADRVASG